MQIAIPAESDPDETRVAATPKTVGRLIGLGYDVLVEAGAGVRASYLDEAYAEAGATVGSAQQAWAADVVLQVNAPGDEQIARMSRGAVLVSLLSPGVSPERLEVLAERGVTALAMDAVPRISRAQSLDVLSSMAGLGGYRAVVEAAHAFGSLFTGQVTAAGKVPPAKVFVIGAGVAGLAAIGTAASLGAVVRAFDVRPEVAEQVESLGATFAQLELPDQDASTDGYARELSEEQERLTLELYARECAEADIVITTALIPGRAAPQLVTAETVAAMRPGSVIVDMAAANGGNCAVTQPEQVVTTEGGVTVVGYTDLPGRLPAQASQLYGTNVVNLMTLLTPDKDGQVVLDLEDQVIRSMTVAHEGQVTWPPPPVQVSAAPTKPAEDSESSPGDFDRLNQRGDADQRGEADQRRKADPRVRRYGGMVLAALVFGLVAAFSPSVFLGHFTVFALAIIVGFYVISNVAHALHTPLMSETNAISGIILVGGILQVGSQDMVVRVVAFAAVVVASINIFGGFAVTGRMLKMFRKEDHV